jgi:hypothetical protein
MFFHLDFLFLVVEFFSFICKIFICDSANFSRVRSREKEKTVNTVGPLKTDHEGEGITVLRNFDKYWLVNTVSIRVQKLSQNVGATSKF